MTRHFVNRLVVEEGATECAPTKLHGVFNSTTGLNRTEAPSRLVRTRTRGVEETAFDAYVIVYADLN